MNDFNNTLLGLFFGVVIFIAVILFMVSVIYFEIIILIALKKIHALLKRKNKSLDSTEEDK
jgi:uncharacterized membrane protein